MNNISYHLYAVRSGVQLCELPFSGNGTLTCDASAEIKRTLSCTLYNIPPEVNLLSDRVRIVMHSGASAQSLGEYIITTAPKTVSASGAVSYACEGYDLGYLLRRRRVEHKSDVRFAAGTLYTDIIMQLLVACGIVDWILPASTLTLATVREDWEVGDNYLTIVNTLLAEINYTSIWFDFYGAARSGPYVSPVLRDVQHDYRAGKNSIVLREHTVQDDTFDACNVFTVSVSNVDRGDPIYCQSVNADPSSRLSTVNRGRIAAPVEKLDGVTDLAAAQAYCDTLRLKSMISTETATIQTAPECGHGVLDIVSVELPELTGKWEETQWSLPLDGTSLMQHTMRRAVYV